MRNYRTIWIAVLLFLAAGCSGKITPEEESAAIHAAEKWLVLVDSGAYGDSWREAADFLKEEVTQDKWLETMTAVRQPMGSLISRKIKSTQFRTMMPKVLKGKYLIIDYETSFSKNKSVVESITQMMETDGIWRVGGYHLDQPGGK